MKLPSRLKEPLRSVFFIKPLMGLGLLIPVPLAILGAITRDIWFIYTMLLVIAGIVGLIGCTNIIPKKLYPLAIFSISLSLLYQTTLISSYLVGTDIHSEYYYYKEALDGWDKSIAGNYNTAIGIVLIAPFLTNTLHIDGIWIFKAIYPFLFSLAPVLLYLAYKELIEPRQALLASFFFMSMPSFMLEVVGITKLQLSGLCLALVIFLLFYRKWTLKLRLPLIVLASILLIMFHYSTGYIYLFFIGIGTGFILTTRLFKQGISWTPFKVYPVLTIVIIGGIIAYFSLIGSSMVSPLNWIEPTNYVPPPSAQYIQQQEPVIHTALGLDFPRATADGKIFRILQILTEVFIISGFFVVVFQAIKKRKFPIEYLALCGAGMLLLAVCIFLPEFSKLVNMSRFYHLTLYFIAPLFIIGGLYILKPLLKQRALPIMTLVIVIPYFLFTSGFVFEAMGKPDISKFDIPYSISLSGTRIDVVAKCTEEDWQALEWVSKSGLEHLVYADIHGTILMRGWKGLESTKRIKYLTTDLSKVSDDAWIFLRKWNEENKMLTYHAGIGLRKSISYEELRMSKLLKDREIVYQSSQACIYGERNNK